MTLWSRRAAAWVLAAGAGSLAVTAALVIAGAVAGPPSPAGASARSYGALGTHAFAEMLREMGVVVVESGAESGARAGESAVLIAPVEEPGPDPAASTRSRLAGARRAVLILPKWRGTADPDRPGWIASAEPLAAEQVEGVLSAAASGSVVRPEGSAPWTTTLAGTPALSEPQLVRSPEIEPLVARPDGILVGEVRSADAHLVIVADPDLLANHGIGRGDNAAIAAAAVDRLRDADDAVIIDESEHSPATAKSVWRALFTYPVALVTFQALLAAIALAWAGLRRFGSPAPPEPAVRGAAPLVGRAAALLRAGGYEQHGLRRYLRMVRRTAARALGAPPALSRPELDAWLDRIGRARGARDSFAALADEIETAPPGAVPPARATALARRLHRWRQEVIRVGP